MAINIDCTEKDIEDLLSYPHSLEAYFGLRYINRQVKIWKFFIDILAYSPDEKCFYIIELKKGEITAKALAQAIRYQRLLNIKYKGKHKFKILLVGENLHEELHYCVTNYEAGINNSEYNYSLYAFEIMSGISFSYYNKEQKHIQKILETNEWQNDL